jgi:O-antigen ligase
VKIKQNKINALFQNVNSYFFNQRDSFTLPALGILLFVFYVFTQRWFELYLQIRIYQVAVVGLALLFIALGVFDKTFIRNKLTVIDFLWLPAIAFILINIFLVGFQDYYSYLFFYVAGFVFLMVAKVDIKAYGASFSFIKIAGIIYALGSITQYFFTDSFNKFIFNFTTPYSQASITSLVQNNYYPGFGFGRTPIAPGYISIAMGLVLSFWDNYRNKLKLYYLDIIIFSILFFGLIITGKRSILLWTIISLPLAYYHLGHGREKYSRVLRTLVALAMLIIILITAVQFSDELPFLNRLSNLYSIVLSGEVTGSVAVRLSFYQVAWAIFLENPLFGVGWMQFRTLASLDHHVHNVYLQLLTEMGIVGFIVVMAPFIYTYYATCKALNRFYEQSNKVNSFWKKGLAFSLYYQTFFLLYCISDNPFFELIFMLMYFLAISIVNSFIVLEKNNLADDQRIN